jgi:hypothetical protein
MPHSAEIISTLYCIASSGAGTHSVYSNLLQRPIAVNQIRRSGPWLITKFVEVEYHIIKFTAVAHSAKDP